MIDLGGDVSGSGLSMLGFTVLSAVAEAERDRIRERVAVVKADQHARGRYRGGIIPPGHAVGADSALEAQPDEPEAIVRMRRCAWPAAACGPSRPK